MVDNLSNTTEYTDGMNRIREKEKQLDLVMLKRKTS